MKSEKKRNKKEKMMVEDELHVPVTQVKVKLQDEELKVILFPFLVN